MVLGVSLLVIDLHATSHGALTIAGLIALGFGLALLFKDQPATYHVNLWIVVGIGSAIAALWAFVAGVKIGWGRRSDSRSPTGRRVPQTSPVAT